MATIRIDQFPDDKNLYLHELAAYLERTPEAQARFMLCQALERVSVGRWHAVRLPDWLEDAVRAGASERFCSESEEIILRLAKAYTG